MTLAMMFILGYATLIYFAITAALSVGLSYVAALLTAPKDPKFLSDNRPTTLANRGSFIPLLIGTRRVGPVFLWAGKRATHSNPGAGGDGTSTGTTGGKGFGGGGSSSPTIYYEWGFHALCIGPCTSFNRVIVGGKQQWPKKGGTFVTPTDTPNGSILTCNDGSKFQVWWGYRDQPVNGRLSTVTAVASGWPNVCYVLWMPKKLGPSPIWPNIEYELAVVITDSALSQSPAQLDRGANPAHALWQILTSPYPRGLGLDPALFDGDAFEALGVQCAKENLGVNLIATDGVDAASTLTDLMQDVGFMLPQVGALVRPVPIRPPAVGAPAPPTLIRDAIVGVDPQVEQHHGDLMFDRLVYTFDDRDLNYRSRDVQLDVDYWSRQNQRSQTKTLNMPTITDLQTAYVVAARRQIEEGANGVAFTFDATRDARLLSPGMTLLYPGVAQVRVAGIKLAWDTTKVTVQTLLDQFSNQPGAYDPNGLAGGGGGTSPDAPVAQDLFVKAMQVPAALAEGATLLAVARVRGSDDISGAEVWISDDATNYVDVGAENAAAAGGTLNSPIAADDADPSPSITSYNDDIGDVLDLSAVPGSWTGGQQVCVIDAEWFFLKRVTAVTGGWKLDGLLRAKYGTTAAAHATNAPVIIFEMTAQSTSFTSPIIQPGATISVKTQPSTPAAAADLSRALVATVTLV